MGGDGPGGGESDGGAATEGQGLASAARRVAPRALMARGESGGVAALRPGSRLPHMPASRRRIAQGTARLRPPACRLARDGDVVEALRPPRPRHLAASWLQTN